MPPAGETTLNVVVEPTSGNLEVFSTQVKLMSSNAETHENPTEYESSILFFLATVENSCIFKIHISLFFLFDLLIL